MFVCKNDLECPEDKDFDEHYHSYEKCEVCGKMTTCAECLCGRRQLRNMKGPQGMRRRLWTGYPESIELACFADMV